MPMRIERATEKYFLLGVAFDYMLRLLIKRNIPHADLRLMSVETASGSFPDLFPTTRIELENAGYSPYILGEADSTPELDLSSVLEKPLEDGIVALKMIDDPDDPGICLVLDISEVRRDAEKKLGRIKEVTSGYIAGEDVPFADLAWACIVMSLMDDIYRSWSFMPARFFIDIDKVDYSVETDELQRLFSIIPDSLIDMRCQYLLNPVLGISDSNISVGADCDLIICDNIVEIKVISKNSMDIDMMNQLLGYFFLIRRNRSLGLRILPEIQHVSIYFARHGYLWSMPVTVWQENPNFKNAEKLFWNGLRSTK